MSSRQTKRWSALQDSLLDSIQSCLARSDCRKPKSALGPQKCGACGAKHWELVRDRTSGNYLVMANDRKQCLVREPRSEDVKKHLLALQKKKKRLEDSFDAKRPSLANGVVMQPCDKGFTLLQLVERPFHDVGFQLQTADGACFTGADFRRCDAKSASLIWGGGVRFDRKGEAQKFFYKVSEASLREREIYVYVFTFARELSL